MRSRTRFCIAGALAPFFWRRPLNTWRAAESLARSPARRQRWRRSSDGPASVSFLGVRRDGGALVYACADEEVEERAVDPSLPALRVQDVERRLHGHRVLVGPVARGQSVIDVGDRHDPRLERDLV